MEQPVRSIWSSIGTVVAVAALILATIAVFKASDDEPGTPLLGAGRSASEKAGAADTDQPATPIQLEVALSEFAIEPKTLEALTGEVSLSVANEGAIPHNVVIEELDARTADINGGDAETLALGTLEAGEYQLFCDIPGHADAGMRATLTVSEQASGDHASHSTADGAVDWAALDQAMMDTIRKFPQETAGIGAQPLEPTILEDGTKEFRLTAEITEWEVEEGRIVEAWTYNGQVPGPLIKVNVGDDLRVVVENRFPMGTDVHWHGVSTPHDQDGVAPITQELIEPGETFVYEFTATEPAVGMYHAHNHAQMKVVNGALGPIMIGDVALPEGRTIGGRALPDEIEVSQELPLVLNDAGVIGYSLNGKSFPATAPVVTEQGDWILVHYMNEGLQIHPMHLHQFPQLIVAKDGHPLDQPYWADTVNVAPGERYSVLINTSDPGTWVWHCHILTHVERDEGMFGMVTAVVVQ